MPVPPVRFGSLAAFPTSGQMFFAGQACFLNPETGLPCPSPIVPSQTAYARARGLWAVVECIPLGVVHTVDLALEQITVCILQPALEAKVSAGREEYLKHRLPQPRTAWERLMEDCDAD